MTRGDAQGLLEAALTDGASLHQPFEQSADVVVIGSGPAGAACGRELARHGLEVLIVEEGGPVRPDDLPGDALTSMIRHYRDMGTSVTWGRPMMPYLQGVAATCLYDNMKVVVTRYEDIEPIYNPRFLAFATHYGFRPQACRPRRPQTKGKVERPFAYAESSLLNGRTFRTLAHLNEVTRWWLAEVADVRIHQTTRKTPRELHALEQPHLLPVVEEDDEEIRQRDHEHHWPGSQPVDRLPAGGQKQAKRQKTERHNHLKTPKSAHQDSPQCSG